MIAQASDLFLGMGMRQWGGLLFLAIAGLALHEIARLIALAIVRIRARKTGAKSLDGERGIRRGAGLLAFVLPWYLFLDQLELSPLVAFRIGLVVEALTILGAVLAVYGIWDAVCDAIAHRATSIANAERLLIPVTRKLVRFVILVAGILTALGVFGVNITGLLAGVGIGGLVVALAAKDSVENVFGSLTILFDMPFALGDWVKIDAVEGIVEEINLRSTKIRTFEDSLITLPNSNLIKAAVENFGARRYRRQRFMIKLSYANEPVAIDRFIQDVRGYLGQVPEVVEGRTIVELSEMTDAAVGVLVQCFFEADKFHDEARLRGQLMLAIFLARDDAGVLFIGSPLPPYTPPDPPPEPEERRKLLDKEDII